MPDGATGDGQREVSVLSFEEALAELEAIVRRLEDGKGKLDEAVTAYERGTLLKRHCEAKLAEARAKIEQIVVGVGGATRTEPFDERA